MQITADHPFWDGTFWAVYPNRGAQPGTNSTGRDGIMLLMTWTDPVLKQLIALQNAPQLSPILQRAANGECRNLSLEDAAHTQWNLSTTDGACIFPVIHEDARDPIYAAGEQIGKRIAKAVLENDQRKLIGGAATLQQAHLIEAHELILGGARHDCAVRKGRAAPCLANRDSKHRHAYTSARRHCAKTVSMICHLTRRQTRAKQLCTIEWFR